MTVKIKVYMPHLLTSLENIDSHFLFAKKIYDIRYIPYI